MRSRIRQVYDNLSLATKIRCSYLVLLVPIVLVLVFCFYNLWAGNRSYEDMVNSTVMASEFSLDFKKDFDYETYLLIVGDKTAEESKVRDMLFEANRIVAGLKKLTDSTENLDRLASVEKYLDNLGIYIDRIEENLQEGNRYESNIEIWENDVQIVTSLVQDTFFQYIYYEVRGIQQSRAEYQNSFVSMIRYLLLASVCILLLILFLSYFIPLGMTKPINELIQVTDQVAKGNLEVRADVRGGMEADMLGSSLNTMIDKLNELLEQVKKEQIRLRRAEFELLQAQINPHFLYNTLDAIVWLAEAGEQKKVVKMVGNLSDFFRTSLNQGRDIISIREEIQHVRSYLEIQQVRYQDILNYEIRVPEELEKYQIPKFTIQPLVENALYHGIKNKRGAGRIVISGQKEKEYFVIRITDDGIGMSGQRLEQIRNRIKNKEAAGNDIYGLYNVNERIRLNFGEAYGITIESAYEKGTVVNIVLPYADGLQTEAAQRASETSES